jgi:hypothetical protein
MQDIYCDFSFFITFLAIFGVYIGLEGQKGPKFGNPIKRLTKLWLKLLGTKGLETSDFGSDV